MTSISDFIDQLICAGTDSTIAAKVVAEVFAYAMSVQRPQTSADENVTFCDEQAERRREKDRIRQQLKRNRLRTTCNNPQMSADNPQMSRVDSSSSITKNLSEDRKKEPKSASADITRDKLAVPWVEGDWVIFWDAYPHKIGKADARKAFERATRKVVPEILFPALMIYANKTDDRPFCNPSTWLNQERWLDRPAKFNGRRTVQQAADDLLAKLQEIEQPAPICDDTSETVIRLLPPNECG